MYDAQKKVKVYGFYTQIQRTIGTDSLICWRVFGGHDNAIIFLWLRPVHSYLVDWVVWRSMAVLHQRSDAILEKKSHLQKQKIHQNIKQTIRGGLPIRT